MDDDDHPLFTNNVTALLIAMGSAAFVVTMYHVIAVCLCSQHVADQNPEEQQAQRHRHRHAGEAAGTTGSTPVSQLIPVHKYQKKSGGGGVADGDEDGTCTVCLGDFEEGEELRTLPECMHSFHVPCIDMWLFSHSSCPVCRADATPSPAVLPRLPEVSSGELNAHHSIDMMQIALVQNGLGHR